MALTWWEILLIVIAAVLVAAGIGVGIYYAVKPSEEECEGANTDGLCDPGYYAKYISE